MPHLAVPPRAYLLPSAAVNYEDPSVALLASKLKRDTLSGTVKSCFEWVRDNIKHSSDFELNPVTWRASDVLTHGTGYCFAKSHLLAALLRANGVAAGFCYQRLRDGDRFLLHGLNAVWFSDIGWYRLDPRGNKPGVDAQFHPPVERLAWAMEFPGEVLLPEVWPEPLPIVLDALAAATDWEDFLATTIPDIEVALGDPSRSG